MFVFDVREFFLHLLWHHHWRVRSGEGKEQKERLAAVLAGGHELRRLLAEGGREVAIHIGRLSAIPKLCVTIHLLACLFTLGLVIKPPAAEQTIKLIEAAVHGMELLFLAEVPFTDQRCSITRLAEIIGNCRHTFSQPGFAVFFHPVWHAIAVLVAGGHKSGASGTAHRSGHITVGEPNPILGDRVDMRRGNVFGSMDAAVRITHIVGDYRYDVGFGGGSPSNAGNAKNHGECG